MSYEHATPLQLILEPREVRLPHITLAHDVVMGIVLSDELLRHRDYDVGRHYLMSEQTLPARVANGLLAFFERFYTTPPDASTSPSHLLFLKMLQEGGAGDSTTLPDLTCYDLSPHTDPKFQAGHLYVLGTSAQPHLQGVVGLKHPHHNLSPLGDEGVLARTNTPSLKLAVGATVVHEVALAEIKSTV